jgi:catechol 2,3-dioxygenase-like lactoylglutathione lyase family enzyme
MDLSSTMIFAKDMQRMTAFYRDGIGLRLLEEKSQDGWAEFDAGAVVLALHAIPAAIAKDIELTSPPKMRDTTPIKLIFRTADVAQARAHLIEHGAVMFEPRSWGACDGMDPEGNVFRIVKA